MCRQRGGGAQQRTKHIGECQSPGVVETLGAQAEAVKTRRASPTGQLGCAGQLVEAEAQALVQGRHLLGPDLGRKVCRRRIDGVHRCAIQRVDNHQIRAQAVQRRLHEDLPSLREVGVEPAHGDRDRLGQVGAVLRPAVDGGKHARGSGHGDAPKMGCQNAKRGRGEASCKLAGALRGVNRSRCGCGWAAGRGGSGGRSSRRQQRCRNRPRPVRRTRSGCSG